MSAIFLLCALALPSPNLRADYMLLKQYIEKQDPNYECVFINENEQLLMPKKDAFIHVPSEPTGKKEYLHIWMLRKNA